MAKNGKKWLVDNLRDGFKYATSKRAIPVLKGTIAYVIAFVLIFTRKYVDLSEYPPALASMLIVTIAGGPGKPFGACLQGVVLAMAGVLVGGGFFAILAKLVAYPVAQAFVFAFIVYLISIVKTLGLRWFAFSLLAILMAFNGIYTSILLGGVFSPTYLLEYIKAYAWGVAIVLAVNILVFPTTSERELRKTIVASLEHLATFAALLGKAYTLTGTAEDKAARELLSQSVKADFTFLTQKIEETSVEINWSKYSMQDYQRFTDRIRMLQRSLITAHVSFQGFDEQDIEVFKNKIMPETRLAFTRLRRDIDFTIREIGESLGCGPMFIEATQTGYLQCLDRERAAYLAGQGQGQNHLQRTVSRKTEDQEERLEEEEATVPINEVEQNLASVAKRLRLELGSETPAPAEYMQPGTPPHTSDVSPTAGGSTAYESTGTTKAQGSPTIATIPSPFTNTKNPGKSTELTKESPNHKYGPTMIKQHFSEFQTAQREIFVQLLTSSDPGEQAVLKIHQPGPSISEMYGGDYLRGDVDEGDLPNRLDRAARGSQKTSFKTSKANTLSPTDTRDTYDINNQAGADDDEFDDDEEKRMRSKKAKNNGEDDNEEDGSDDTGSVGPTPEFKTNQTLVRVYSLLFAWDRFVENLSSLHTESTLKTRRKGLHFHVYENLVRAGKKPMPESDSTGIEDPQERREDARELSIKEALALLENRSYTPVKTTWLERLGKWNKWLGSDQSVFAGKSAAAASVFGILLFAETTRQWFINYSLTVGLLTCIVALAPTLGQSLMTFVLQICGSGFGTLIGWTILQMFKDVGGYPYNPYGMCVMLGLISIPLQYLIYERPQLFVLALLALNSAGSIVIIEDIYVNYYHRLTFDTPALRAGKFMVSLGVALGIVITFQLFVLRSPARRNLRRQLGELVYSNLAYNTILQAYVRSVLPADPKHRGKPMVLKRIERELKYREAKMQLQIFEMSPMLVFAAAEPSFGKAFRGDVIQTIIQANQIILDRLREGRAAIGDRPFDPFILENMVSVLSPYRRRATRINKTGFYLCAASLMSKSPLPHDSVLTQHVLNHFVHDALLLSSQLTRTEDGAKAIQGDSFHRYWFYLISVSGVQTQLKRIEMACKELFGELEDDPRLQ